METLTPYYLLKYGVSINKVLKLSESGETLVGIMYEPQRVKIKGNVILQKNKDMLDSIFYLTKFGITHQTAKLLEQGGIDTISKASDLDEKKLYNIFKRGVRKLYDKLSRALANFRENQYKYKEELSILEEYCMTGLLPKNNNMFSQSEHNPKIDKYFIQSEISIFFLYQFLEYKDFLVLIDKEISYIDFLLPSIKILTLTTKERKKLLSIKSNDFRIPYNIFNDISLLMKYGLDKRLVLKLKSYNISKISKLKKMNYEKYLDVFPGFTKNDFSSIQQGILLFEKSLQENPKELIKIRIIQLLISKKSLDKEKIFIFLNDCGFSFNDSIESLNELILSRILVIDQEDIIAIYEMSLNDIVNSEIENLDIFVGRLKGKTLEQIANKKEISRERVRQLQSIFMNSLPKLKEDRLYENVKEYNLSEYDFKLIFDESSLTYNYLKLKNGFSSKGRTDYITSHPLTPEKKNSLFEHLKIVPYIDGTNVRASRLKFFDKCLFENKENSYVFEDFQPIYDEYVNSHGFPQYSQKNIRGFSEKSLYTIHSNRRKFRYYNLGQHINSVETIDYIRDILTIDEGVYGASYFDLHNMEHLNELGLYNGYELANLINRIGVEKFPNLIKINRGSEFQIGIKDKKDFYLKQIFENNGLHISDLVSKMNREYGLILGTVQSYIRTNFNEYFINDYVNINIDLPEDEKFYTDFKTKLNRIIYSRKEVEEIISSISNEDIKVSQALLSKVRYKIQGDYVFRMEYSSVKKALISYIKETPIFNANTNFNFKSPYLYQILRELIDSNEMFQISEFTYIRNQELDRVGIGIKEIEDFIKYVSSFPKETYFNLFHLQLNGFTHPLLDLGFEDIFYERIISSCDEFEYMNINHEIILYCFTKTNMEVKDFLYSELNLIGDSYSIDFINTIKEKYGLNLDGYNVRQKILAAGGFYSTIMDKYYVSKENYYKEVYK